jgi:parvulin-like peptidyl-prolyl isomerase
MAQYDSAVLSELVVAEEGLAAELALQTREEGADFASLARRHSTAASRADSGFLGELRRGRFSGAESAAVFGAHPDDVVGPFAQGRQFRLLRVHEVRRAKYTDAVRREIEDTLWSEWLLRRIQAARPEITVLAHL